jgi:alpha-L-fucosidase
MQNGTFNRRQMLLGTGASLAGLALTGTAAAAPLAQAAASSPAPTADRARRMQWWHAAKFGMFHFGGIALRKYLIRQSGPAAGNWANPH